MPSRNPLSAPELQPGPSPSTSADLYFAPTAPTAAEGRWIKTIPGKGWFVYFRIHGPDTPAFDGSWRLPDFEPTG